MTNLYKSHSFIIRKANGIDDFRVQMRAGYWKTITSERRTIAAIKKVIARYNISQPALGAELQKKLDNRQILDILRFFGMLAGSERITFNQK